ncbi:MAG TPA: hypothetical protein VMH40_03275 [Myxococcaceae bacterium]|nr:hypothetical protein [Myxococcaceae bacterium]
MPRLRCTLLGVGAMRSPRFAPAGLLVALGRTRVMLDGGPGAVPAGRLDAWLVTDDHAELIAAIRRIARARGCEPAVNAFAQGGLRILPRPVRHTSHPAFGYDIRAGTARAVWAPEFLVFPRWARGTPLLFAEGSGWSRRIWFAGRVGGHASIDEVCVAAARERVGRLVFAHLGRPTLAALDRGCRPPLGEIGREGRTYCPLSPGSPRRSPRPRPGGRSRRSGRARP